MNPLLLQMIPVLIDGIKTGADIIARLSAGDETAEQQAKDWLGITGEVSDAVKAWEASKATAQK